MTNIKDLETEEKRLNELIEKEKKLKSTDFITGGIFDNKSFNNRVNYINKLSSEKNNIKNKIKLEKLNYEPLDYNKKTIGDFKKELIDDTLIMINELYNLTSFDFNKINNILNIKYRKITLLIFILIFLILIYSLIHFLD